MTKVIINEHDIVQSQVTLDRELQWLQNELSSMRLWSHIYNLNDKGIGNLLEMKRTLHSIRSRYFHNTKNLKPHDEVEIPDISESLLG